MKWIKVLCLICFITDLCGQSDSALLKTHSILVQDNSVQGVRTLYSDVDSSVYLYTSISVPTDSVVSHLEIGDTTIEVKQAISHLWIARLDRKGDTLFTRHIFDTPRYRLIQAALIKNNVLYFILSKNYMIGDNEVQGLLFMGYDPPTGKSIFQPIYEQLYPTGINFFPKNKNSLYLLVKDKPHACLPPEWTTYILELSHNGKILQKKAFNKDICIPGAYSPDILYRSQNGKYLYVNDADFYKTPASGKNSCRLDLYDVYGQKAIPYRSCKRYISVFDSQTLKRIRRIPLNCDKWIFKYINDSDFVYVIHKGFERHKKMIFQNNKQTVYGEVEIDVYPSNLIYRLGSDLFCMDTSSDKIKIMRIRDHKLLYTKTYLRPVNNKDRFFEIIPVVKGNRIRYFYEKLNENSLPEIGYFDE